jgi:two-component system chemotaxis response regulator CheY
MRILIVDDSMYIRSVLTKIFEDAGHSVCGEAKSSKEAIEKYQDLRPDLVTMDIIMPDMNGIVTVKKIRTLDPEAKIIMISAMEQKPLTLEALQAGAVDYVVKPFKPDHVLSAIQKLTQK